MTLLPLSVLLLSVNYILPQTSAFHTQKAVPPPLQIKKAPITTTSLALASTTATKKAKAKVKVDDSRTAPSEVVSKFDSYASTFEEHLVKDLKYCAPLDVAKSASERIATTRNGKPYASALDAGCGTGLAGPHLRPLVSGSLVGVDLSPKMVELAAELVVDDGEVPVVKDRMRRCAETARLALASEAPDRLYEGLFTADLLRLENAKLMEGYGLELEEIPMEPFDLIVSADVLVYFGAMDEILRVFSDRLAAGGDLIFTTETMNAGDYNWVETVSGRFAQSPEYVERMAADAGLAKVSQTAFTPRMESGEKVLGTLHIFTKP
mmetsp:Transcript_41056/g.86124  ORF Transcript_41056/g.86124 Transcript_41056/m.86124 type:complete len:322 (+) Transcript_41056:34-999(+)